MVGTGTDHDPFHTAQRIPRRRWTRESAHVTNAPPSSAPPHQPSRRQSYWDRPKPARDWHWFLGRLGSTLIVTGLLVFLFVGYQLWGTGIEAAQSQQRLENSFVDLAVELPDEESEPVTPLTPIPVANGDPLALIEIPAIGVSKYVVAGVDTADLKKGPGHYPRTPFPGELGNAAIAGHRTTYGEPFRQLDELDVGDAIVVTDLMGREFTYRVTGQRVVTPQDSWVVDTVDPTVATLTLTTCHPEFSAQQRLIVFAELDTAISDVATYRATTYDSDTTPVAPPTTEPLSDGVESLDDSVIVETPAPAAVDDVFDKGWFSDPRAFSHVAAWIALEILIVWGAWQIAKRVRNRAIGVVVGFVPFFVVLYFVFQNVNRLLPPNL